MFWLKGQLFFCVKLKCGYASILSRMAKGIFPPGKYPRPQNLAKPRPPAAQPRTAPASVPRLPRPLREPQRSYLGGVDAERLGDLVVELPGAAEPLHAARGAAVRQLRVELQPRRARCRRWGRGGRGRRFALHQLGGLLGLVLLLVPQPQRHLPRLERAPAAAGCPRWTLPPAPPRPRTAMPPGEARARRPPRPAAGPAGRRRKARELPGAPPLLPAPLAAGGHRGSAPPLSRPPLQPRRWGVVPRGPRRPLRPQPAVTKAARHGLGTEVTSYKQISNPPCP